MKRVWLLVCVWFSLGTAQAETSQTLSAADHAFASGQFFEAAALAETQGEDDADALALAARAHLAGYICAENDSEQEAVGLAEGLARRALDLDPAHLEARIQLAISLSLQARNMSARAAWQSGHGQTARELVEGVIADDPDNAYAHGFMAVWHLEVLRRGGRLGAAFLDASARDARHHYAKAAGLTPDDASLHWQMARAYAALNARRYRDEIQAALSAAAAASIDSALEATMAERAAGLANAIETMKARDVERLALDML